MADYVDARVTDYIKTSLDNVSMYGGTTTAELERYTLKINGRYPYIQVCGPYAGIDTETDQSLDTKLQYAIKYYVNKNDESFTPNTEITYLTRTVYQDIVKAVMADQTIGGLAKNIIMEDAGYAEEIVDGNFEFIVYVVVEVEALINRLNPELSY